MSISDQPDDIRRNAKHAVPTVAPAPRRAPEKPIARWIGAAGRKPGQPGADAAFGVPAGEVPAGQVIKLSWADTFGRPARPDLGRSLRTAPETAQVLPFQGPADRTASASRRGGDQPSVPVLR